MNEIEVKTLSLYRSDWTIIERLADKLAELTGSEKQNISAAARVIIRQWQQLTDSGRNLPELPE